MPVKKTRIQIRRDSLANWQTDNPILADCEIGIARDDPNRRCKLGDGQTAWNALAWWAGGGSGSGDSGGISPIPLTTANSETVVSASTANPVYYIDTTAGPVSVKFKASPSIGDMCTFIDIAGTFATHNFILEPYGSKLLGTMNNYVCAINHAILTVTYVGEPTGILPNLGGSGQQTHAHTGVTDGGLLSPATPYAISISGNAATADRLRTAITINGQVFDGTGNLTIQAQPQPHAHTSAADGGPLSSTVAYNISIAGNAATATALKNALTLYVYDSVGSMAYTDKPFTGASALTVAVASGNHSHTQYALAYGGNQWSTLNACSLMDQTLNQYVFSNALHVLYATSCNTASYATTAGTANFASSAAYSDYAEWCICADDPAPGTLLVPCPGAAQVMACDAAKSPRVVGVVSTKPGFVIGSERADAPGAKPVAYTGFVLVRVVGPVVKAEPLVSAGAGTARAADPDDPPYLWIGFAAATDAGSDERLVMVSLKRG